MKNDSIFQTDEGNFYKKTHERSKYKGQVPTMAKLCTEMAILQKWMKVSDANKNEIYKLLGYEQTEKIDLIKNTEILQVQMNKRARTRVGEGLHDKTLVKMINSRLIPVVAYMRNARNFKAKELNQLDKLIKKVFKGK